MYQNSYSAMRVSPTLLILTVSFIAFLSGCIGDSDDDPQTFAVSGSISGLEGEGLGLELNGGQGHLNVDPGAETFEFEEEVVDGGGYSVEVIAQPEDPGQACTVSNGSGTVEGEDIEDIQVECETDTFPISGSVSGLEGEGLKLSLNDDTDTVSVAPGADSFEFDKEIEDGSDYEIEVVSQPSDPVQTCTVTGAVGTVDGGPVDDVEVTCATENFAIGGWVSGLEGEGLVLSLNEGDQELPVDPGATSFEFPDELADGSSYAVTVASQPDAPDQVCTVSNGEGELDGSDVSDIQVDCTTETYNIGGTISGLEGDGLELSLNGGEQMLSPAAGANAFTFDEPLDDQSEYEVEIAQQPSDAEQTCDLSNQSGKIDGGDVEDIQVHCETETYSVGGSVSDLEGDGLELSLNDGEQTLSPDSGASSFDFDPIDDGTEYSVEVAQQPSSPDQTCTVSNGSGTVDGGDVDDIQVDCETVTYDVGGSIDGLEGDGLELSLNDGDQTVSPDAGAESFTFDEPLDDQSEYDVEISEQPTEPSQTCTVSNGSGTVDGNDVEDIEVNCETDSFDIGGEVAGLQGDTSMILTNNGEDALVVDTDGPFTFSESMEDGESYEVEVSLEPDEHDCAVSNGSGTVDGQDVSDVTVECMSDGMLSGISDIMELHLEWNENLTVDLLWSSDPHCDWDNYSVCADSGMESSVSGGQKTFGAIEDELDSDTSMYFVVQTNNLRSNKVSSRASSAQLDDDVLSLEEHRDRLYVGGRFRQAGVLSISGGIVSRKSGKVAAAVQEIDGDILAVEPDGDGGWYIGGEFENVGDHERYHLARLRADGSVDPDWTPETDEPVQALIMKNDTVYVGGNFMVANGVDRRYLAAIDAQDGSLDEGWEAETNHWVWALEILDGTLYAGGLFTAAFTEDGSQAREHLAAFDLETGGLDGGWDPEVDDWVHTLAASNGVVYVGGDYSEIDGNTRNNIAAIDANTGSLQSDWNPGADEQVDALAIWNDTLYVGGAFTEIGGESRDHLAALDLSDGAVDSQWNPGADSSVVAFSISDGAVYAAGWFSDMGGDYGGRVARIDAEDGSVDKQWNPMADEVAYAIGVSSDSVFVGGAFTSIANEHRRRLAAFDVETGTLDEKWDPGADAAIWSLKGLDDWIYMGGGFSEIGQTGRNRLAAVDYEDGSVVDQWAPSSNYSASAMTSIGSSIYIGVGGDRDYLAAFDVQDGSHLSDWEASVDERVFSLDVHDGMIYAGGLFQAVNNEDWGLLARLDANDGGLDADWDPGLSGEFVTGIDFHEDTIYLSGYDMEIEGDDGTGLRAFDLATGDLVEEWAPEVDGLIMNLALRDNQVYVSGSVDWDEDQRLAAFDVEDGSMNEDWKPDVNAQVESLLVSGDKVYIGGWFDKAGGELRGRLAVFDADTGELLW